MTTSVLVEGLAFAEGPRWRGDRLWFSDVPAGEVGSVGLDGDRQVVAEIDGGPSGLGWLPDGTLLVARGIPAAVMAVSPSGEVTEYADLSGVATHPPNDMLVDPDGRVWLGTCDIGGIPTPAATQLICVDTDGAVSVVDAAMRFPNGTVLTPDGRTLVVAETFGSGLQAFTVEDGRAGAKRQWAEVPGSYPDGICLDAEGAVWFADAIGQAAVRVREGGEVVDRVEVEQGCYACTLGGPDLRTLFLCTGQFGPPEQSLANRIGRIETVTVEVAGSGSP
jgi:sugar lactone lactonase YvrE